MGMFSRATNFNQQLDNWSVSENVKVDDMLLNSGMYQTLPSWFLTINNQ